MMHKTTFHTGKGDVLLFPQWILHGKKETYLTCLVLVILGITYQGIKFARQQYGRKCRNLHCKRYMLNKGHILQTLMYLLQFIGGYTLMLSVMTYNIWLLIAVLTGFGLGYFFFGWGEYEDPSAAFRVQMVKPTKSYFQTCGVTPSSSATQELLAINKCDQDQDVSPQESVTNNIRCVCSSKI